MKKRAIRNFVTLAQDLPSEIRKIASFLNKTLTEEQIEKLVDHVKIDKFAKNDSVNMSMEIKAGLGNPGHTFIRKGKGFVCTTTMTNRYQLNVSQVRRATGKTTLARS